MWGEDNLYMNTCTCAHTTLLRREEPVRFTLQTLQAATANAASQVALTYHSELSTGHISVNCYSLGICYTCSALPDLNAGMRLLSTYLPFAEPASNSLCIEPSGLSCLGKPEILLFPGTLDSTHALPLLAPSSVYVGDPAGPVGTALAPAQPHLLPPTPPALPGGLLAPLTQMATICFSLQSCSLHLFSTRPPGPTSKAERWGSHLSNLEWLGLFLAESKLPPRPALFFLRFHILEAQWGLISASSMDPISHHLHLLPISCSSMSTCHQRHRYCRLIPHSPAYSVLFSSSLTGCSEKKGLWSQTKPGFYSYNSITEYVIWAWGI